MVRTWRSQRWRGGPWWRSLAALDRRTPDRRAILGGGLIALALAGAWWSIPRPAPLVQRPVVVASRPIAAGHRLRRGDLEVQRLALPDALADHVLGRTDAAIGRVAQASLRPGELLQPGALGGPGAHSTVWEVPLVVPAAWLPGGGLEVGDTVDVLATTGEGADARTRVVARAVVSALVAPGHSLLDGGDASVTVVAPDRATALRLVSAARAGAVTLVRS